MDNWRLLSATMFPDVEYLCSTPIHAQVMVSGPNDRIVEHHAISMNRRAHPLAANPASSSLCFATTSPLTHSPLPLCSISGHHIFMHHISVSPLYMSSFIVLLCRHPHTTTPSSSSFQLPPPSWIYLRSFDISRRFPPCWWNPIRCGGHHHHCQPKWRPARERLAASYTSLGEA